MKNNYKTKIKIFVIRRRTEDKGFQGVSGSLQKLEETILERNKWVGRNL